ncbi:protein SENESCENCE-ASSOCIATED GENE 21, mitochondrial-like [Phragmites australis]|uniref:protein SENESCENCE-ASSOCIATED GENE 21, mitochondrial-like n=1 Tax=Phragmites australis TaxID=29695 RepID=UPI002D768E7E|nr:protein SENESCENCE-ASSOCIATED GENE 21, mitochondrial-like [Phragmites australis]
MALALSGSARAVLASLAPTRAAAARGYAASTASGAMRSAAASADGAAAGEAKEAGRGAAAEVSWTPDPVTGHYRPANWAAAVDPADLRAAHLARTYARA